MRLALGGLTQRRLGTFAARNTFRKEVPTEAMEDEEAMCIFVETGIIGRFSI